ncbi:MAG: hypothetical protein ACI9UR_002583 [Bacteroidia bacterium]|jgi:hypothetical protein
MKAQNWLYNYQYEWGLQKSLEGLDRRTSVDTQMHESVAIYLQSVPDFLEEFGAFIKDAQGMVGDYFSA